MNKYSEEGQTFSGAGSPLKNIPVSVSIRPDGKMENILKYKKVNRKNDWRRIQ